MRPHIQNVYFVGDQVNVTCRALRVRSGKLAWTFVANGSSGPPIFQDLDNYIDNYVEMVYIPHANACMEQTVSTFFTTAAKEMTNGYLSCFSLTDGTEFPCIGTGDPMEYCITSSELKILDGPEKGPELKISPSDLLEGDRLVALCKVYPGEGGSLVWVIYPGSGGSRTLENHVDTEIASEISTLEEGKLVTISQLEFIVNTSFDGSRIACFAYDIRKTDSLECPVEEELCAISPPFHGLFLIGFFFSLTMLCLAASLINHKKIDFGESFGDSSSRYDAGGNQHWNFPENSEVGTVADRSKSGTGTSGFSNESKQRAGGKGYLPRRI
ncbi:hypothetical protein EGW08_007682 [Elysia chlorotica]|uniref:Uncharacterized protein n=1 Tax=Elysia chlorotica TaxID=188477 RepID=A0A3S0ZWB5_ELYCH|nr:hypothetical protein EGW08_007682 [Elysia chlorotica]